MTDWIVDEACRQSREWHNAGHDLFVSVNLPPAFWQPTPMRQVMSTIDAFGLNADRMMMEITEQAAMSPVADLEPVLAELHARGLRLAIDDFGSGHSSLGRLSQLRVNTLKIDRSFIAELPTDRGASILVESMVTLARQPRPAVPRRGHRDRGAAGVSDRPPVPARPGLPVRPAGARGGVHRCDGPPPLRGRITPKTGDSPRSKPVTEVSRQKFGDCPRSSGLVPVTAWPTPSIRANSRRRCAAARTASATGSGWPAEPARAGRAAPTRSASRTA